MWSVKFTHHSQVSVVSVFISTPSAGCWFELPLGPLLREVWIELLQVSGSWVPVCSTQPQSLTLRDPPIRKKKADLLSLPFSSLLMIPSLSFWEDLSSPLTPVRRGRLKQLRAPSVSRLAKESSRGLLGNAKKTGASVLSAFRRQIPPHHHFPPHLFYRSHQFVRGEAACLPPSLVSATRIDMFGEQLTFNDSPWTLWELWCNLKKSKENVSDVGH